ncbi:MAG: histidine triad nucleotide-binding protein [Firmicutes bacterium]|nr:histidine triad nucleotide-binding protein [Bacillota bacterium]
MTDCVFCKIARGEIPAREVLRDDDFVAFHDLNPQAPVHILVIPKKHYPNVVEAAKEDPGLLGKLLAAVARLAEEQGLLPEGFRLVANTGPNGGQTVQHLHFHILGGRFMGWPPG